MVTFNCYIQYREIATNNQTQRIRRSQTPPASRHQYYNMISYTALCSYPPIRVSCASKHSIQANFLNSPIRAELGISIRSYFNTDISWIDRKKNDDKRCLISREFLLTKCTLFFQKSKLHCTSSSATIRSRRKFRKYLIIEEQENLNNQDELGLQTSCVMLVQGA